MTENWRFFHQEVSPENLIIRSVESALGINPDSANTIPVLTDHNLTIFTDTLNINGPVSLPGQNVFIHARQINSVPGAAIDVSGATGQDFLLGNKPNPLSFEPGTSGTGGARGSQGQNGGTITIFCERITGPLLLVARGGNGGRGQDGGDGVRGGVGADGAHGSLSNPLGQPGGPGGRSGNAGRAGDGGSGGDAGTIQIRTIDTQPPELTLDLAGGRGGQPGIHGFPGMGGPGGPGGRNGRLVRRGSLQDGDTVFVPDGTSAPPGPTGPLGESVLTAASEGVAGTGRPESLEMNLSVITDAELGSFASITQMLMLLHKLELAYLNSAFDDTARALSWIERMTRSSAGTQLPPSVNNVVAPSALEWAALRDRAISFILQLQAGLDYYGHPRNFVPLVAVDSYEDTFEELSQIAQAVQEQTCFFRDRLRDNVADVTMIDRSIASARGSMRALEAESATIRDTQIPETRTSIDLLLQVLQEQQTALLASEQAFQDAVRRQADNCDFFDVINFVSTVLSAARGAHESLRMIISSLNTFRSEDLHFRDVVSTVRAINGELQEIRAAYNSVRDSFTSLNSDTKLVMIDREFEETIQPFLNLPEAQNLRQLMRSYVDTARTRNQKIMDLTSLELRAHELDTKITLQREEIARLNALRVATQDVRLADYVAFVENQLVRAKQDLIKILYLVHRALDYWSLRSTDFSLPGEQSVEDLRAVYARLLAAESLAATDRNRADQSFGPISISLTRDEMPNEFDRLRRTGRLVFTISDDDRAFQLGFAAITLTGVDILVPGARVTGDLLSIRIAHTGDAVFRDTQNRRINFSHNPRFTVVTRNLATGELITGMPNNLGGEPGRFAFISPFATWIIEILDRFNQGQTPDLSQVDRVDLTFSGFFLPFTI